MTARTASRRRKAAREARWRLSEMALTELLVFCPACKALEVMHFSGQEMTPTRKFAQRQDGVYHSCGAGVPCRLFRPGASPPAVVSRRQLEGDVVRSQSVRRALPVAIPVREVRDDVVELGIDRGPGGPRRCVD